MNNLHDYELMLALQRHNPDAFERIREGNLTLDDVRLQAQEALELERTPVRAEDED